MIKRITFQEYGPFRDAELHLGAFTVVVGPNGSGKTTALVALNEPRILSVLEEDSVFLEHRIRRGSERLTRLEFETSSAVIAHEWPQETDQDDWPGTGEVPSQAQRVEQNRYRLDMMLETTPPRILLNLLPNRLRAASYLDTTHPKIHSDGYGLPTVLAHLKLGDDSAFSKILVQTRDIVPTFEGIRFERSRVTIQEGDGEQAVLGDQLLFDMRGAPRLMPSQVSDGTLFTIGLLTALATHSEGVENQPPPLILIDELERSLHPRALVELVGHLRRITEETGVQILATSHSPYLLDALHPEEVRLTGFLDDGTATIRELTDHPDFERWKDEMTPGEFWSLVGEDWIAKTEQPEPEEAKAAEG